MLLCSQLSLHIAEDGSFRGCDDGPRGQHRPGRDAFLRDAKILGDATNAACALLACCGVGPRAEGGSFQNLPEASRSFWKRCDGIARASWLQDRPLPWDQASPPSPHPGALPRPCPECSTYTLGPTSEARNPKPETRNPKPKTHSPKPQTLHSVGFEV